MGEKQAFMVYVILKNFLKTTVTNPLTPLNCM